jgi:serine/threonine protein kinase
LVGTIVNDEEGRTSKTSNYNLDRRKWKDLSTLHNQRIPARTTKEQFQVVNINPQDHDMVEVVYAPDSLEDGASSAKSLMRSKDKPTWNFNNVLVRNIGNGMQTQNDITNNSKDYNRNKPDSPPDNCVPQYPWQTLSFPNCNRLHEMDALTRLRTTNPAEEPEFMLLARGGYRDVWYVETTDLPGDIMGEVVAMKTLLYEHPWTERNMDRHRRDALATERLTGSPYALNLYGYCANTGLYDFADGGSLEDAVDNDTKWQKWTSADKITYAYQVACAIADVHNIDQEGLPSMSHTDISMSQFVSTDNGKTYQINDFNRARFLFRSNDDATQVCPFEVSSNKGKFRAPEEYGTSVIKQRQWLVMMFDDDNPTNVRKFDYLIIGCIRRLSTTAYEPETVAIDNYSMGNIFYVLLTRSYPFEDMKKTEAQEAVKKGQRPVIPDEFLHSEDPIIQALVAAIGKCWTHDPKERATSREIQQYLKPFAEGIAKKTNTHRRKLSASTSL